MCRNFLINVDVEKKKKKKIFTKIVIADTCIVARMDNNALNGTMI